MVWQGIACVQIYTNLSKYFLIAIRVRVFASFNAWHPMTGDRFGCSMVVRHMLFDWIIILPDFINFSTNLLQKRQTDGQNGLRYWMNGNKTVCSISFIRNTFSNMKTHQLWCLPLRQIFIYVDWYLLILLVIGGDIHFYILWQYIYIYLVSCSVRFVWYWELDNSHESI